jgi:hypothetical protein
MPPAEDDHTGGGWTQADNQGAGGSGGRFEGMKFAVPQE